MGSRFIAGGVIVQGAEAKVLARLLDEHLARFHKAGASVSLHLEALASDLRDAADVWDTPSAQTVAAEIGARWSSHDEPPQSPSVSPPSAVGGDAYGAPAGGLVSVGEASTLAGRSSERIRQLLAAGIVDGRQPGGPGTAWFVDAASLAAWIEGRHDAA